MGWPLLGTRGSALAVPEERVRSPAFPGFAFPALLMGQSSGKLRELQLIVEEKADEIRKHWDEHFRT
ncbi:hypothetical protein JCM31598_21630 [Desulfonatronum parangueonense]